MLEALPYLQAVIKESMCLRGATPTLNPRLTPQHTTTTLGSYHNISLGVRVSAFAWCLHCNESVYPHPKRFIPERWMDVDKDQMEKKERWFWAFGSGSRMCLG